MFIKKLLIRNYRCFDNSPTIIEFSKSGLTALIGPNNVGKSTVLKVLEILLGDKWPSSQFNEDDFHDNKLNEEILLACEFIQPISIDVYGRKIDVNGVIIKARHLKTGYGESSVEVDYFLIENINDFEKENWTVVEYKRGNPVKISQSMKNELPVIITVPLIKLQYEQPTNKWGVLGRMLQKVERIFSENKDVEKDFTEKMTDAVNLLRSPEEFKQIEGDIKDFWIKMRPTNLGNTHLEFLDFEPWRYYRQFKLAIRRNGKPVPIETLGEGVQRLAIIALYRTYLKCHGRSEKAILLVEEPESYLHPQARKTLFDVLKRAIGEDSSVEGQIIYTTHSEDFIECGDFDDIVILWLEDNKIIARNVNEEVLKLHTEALSRSLNEISNQKIHYRFMETITQGLKEALFAPKAIIVEGPSEIELLRFFSDVDRDQIAVVSAGGKNNIPSIYAFLTGLGIPSFIVIDRDEKEDDKGTNKKIVEMLNQAKVQNPDHTRMDISEKEIDKIKDGKVFYKDRLLVFGKDLETVLGNIIDDYSKILKLLRNYFKLPDKKGPRDIQALGLAYIDVFEADEEIKSMIDNNKEALDKFSEELNKFVKQDVKRPTLLIPLKEPNLSDKTKSRS